MSYQVLYRKWRPTVFDDLLGQEHIVDTLRNEITSERLAHAYLFCGSHGTGKTSAARLLSRAVNCKAPINGNPCNVCSSCVAVLSGNLIDVYEIDAASNNGVDNIREIKDEIVYVPSQLKYKFYIIDEVHMLSSGAFNALLKMLEEPPGHVIFVLATTESHKVPVTVLSRCQRFNFRRIDIKKIISRINYVAEADDIKIDDKAVELIAEVADGSMRDALSLLEQCQAYGDERVTYDKVINVAALVDRDVVFDIIDAVIQKNIAIAFSALDKIVASGKDILNLFENLVHNYKDMLLCQSFELREAASLIDKSEAVTEKIIALGKKYSKNEIINSISILSEYMLSAKWLSQPCVALELALVKLCQPCRCENVEESIVYKQKNGNHDLWNEVLGKIKVRSKQLFAFLASAQVVQSGDKMIINLDNEIAYERINKPEGLKYIKDVLCEISGKELALEVNRGFNHCENDSGQHFSDSDQHLMNEIIAKKDILGSRMDIQ